MKPSASQALPQTARKSKPASGKALVPLRSAVRSASAGRATKAAGLDAFVSAVHEAEPMRLIESERQGVPGALLKELAKRLEIPAQRMFEIVGVPKATAEKKVAAGEWVAGSAGRSALGIARLLGMAQEIVANSTAAEAKGFDCARWLGQWLETPQAALGGRRPADIIDTPTGLEVVSRLLGSIESGAYQ